jgi:hypothetical protein
LRTPSERQRRDLTSVPTTRWSRSTQRDRGETAADLQATQRPSCALGAASLAAVDLQLAVRHATRAMNSHRYHPISLRLNKCLAQMNKSHTARRDSANGDQRVQLRLIITRICEIVALCGVLASTVRWTG